MKARIVISAAAIAFGVASLAGVAAAQDLPPLPMKERYKVGFPQMESNNPWRIAETKSFHDTADACGWDLVATDATSHNPPDLAMRTPRRQTIQLQICDFACN